MAVAEGFDRVLLIDENSLDQEWIEQPKLYFTYAEKLAAARREYESAKNELEVLKADLDQSIRSDPAEYGIAKLTEAAVAAAIQDSAAYKEVQRKIIETKHAVDVYQAAVAALDQRRTALENLVKLFLAGYYAKPTAEPADREQVEELVRRRTRGGGRAREG